MLNESTADRFTSDGRDAVDRIAASVRHMEKLIEGLLSFSRAGEQQLLKTTVDMNKIVEEVCHTSMSNGSIEM